MSIECQPLTRITVSIIIPCRNEESTIEECLNSILAQEPCEGTFEIIVADGASTDRTRDIVQRISLMEPHVRLIDNPGRIVSTGLNMGIGIARGDIIMRMDAHTVYASDYIRKSVMVLQQTGADNVGGPALTLAQGVLQKAISAAYHSPFSVGGARFHNPRYEGWVDTVPYGCWPKNVFSRIGLFDEELVRNQDDEFNLRITRSGGKIWQSPQLRSWYRTRGSLSELFKQYRQYGYWKVRVIQKHRVPASLRHLVPAGFVSSLAALPLVGFWWDPALWGAAALLALYLPCIIIASVAAAGKEQWRLFPVLPLVFATYHVSYGLGFLQGVLDFVLTNRKPHQSLINLSRRPVGL